MVLGNCDVIGDVIYGIDENDDENGENDGNDGSDANDDGNEGIGESVDENGVILENDVYTNALILIS